MAAAIDQAIGYLDDIFVNFNGLVIMIAGLVHNTSYCVKIYCIICLCGKPTITFLKVYILLNKVGGLFLVRCSRPRKEGDMSRDNCGPS
jgi:hypothetical protein